ncbi:hypothetical protein PRECH8_22370 [Insulibacter thermoxylanivorax]|uniref:Uncharacterized protein n=1 Tax=Insulibacter thermoxylanivorax TaxID=2749268 RepID=A0A916QI82_9BACL|nr:hypothetical protein PRECH8_22370 [Insulibacter thermoxylanivorax]
MSVYPIYEQGKPHTSKAKERPYIEKVVRHVANIEAHYLDLPDRTPSTPPWLMHWRSSHSMIIKINENMVNLRYLNSSCTYILDNDFQSG